MGSRVKEREKRGGGNENATRKKICREVERKNEEKSKKGFEPRKFPQSPDKCYQFHVRSLETYLRFSLYRTIGTNET